MNELFGSIETGGTKIKVALIKVLDYQNLKLKIITEKEIPTDEPVNSMSFVKKFFISDIKNIKAIGVSTFGPVNIKTGEILNTPKLKWVNFNILNYLKKELNFNRFAFTSDVNGAGYGEYRIGAAKNTGTSVYTTVGTGIGCGIVMNGSLYPLNNHAEIGHIYVKKHPLDNDFDGICPYHKGCLEGLASGPTYQSRTGKKGQDLSKNNPVHNIIAYYLAQLCVSLTLSFRPDKLVFGGGVSKDLFLFEKVRNEFNKLLNEYITIPTLNNYIIPAKLGQNAGILGSALLAIDKFI